MTPSSDTAPQPIGTHLDELRRRLLRALIVVAVATGIAFFLAPILFRWLLQPYHTFLAAHGHAIDGAVLQTLRPAETFKMSIQLALLIGGVVVCPYLLYEVWGFVHPGLTRRERRWLAPSLAGGLALFAVGAAFAYRFILPITLGFFWEYSLRLGITPAWAVEHYIGFVLGTLVSFGMAFELPLGTMCLAATGLVTPDLLRTKRRYAYFLIAIGAAILTPPDALSMCLMGIPLLALYECSIGLARLVTRTTR